MIQIIVKERVLLINPRKGWRPPLGLLYVASYLENAGYSVKVIEFIDENYNTIKNKKLWKEFYEYDPDFIGFGVISWNRSVTVEIIKQIRDTTKDKIIICGGKDPSYVPEKYINSGANVVVIGEGEETMVELLNACSSQSDLDDVKGIVFKNGSSIVTTAHREPINLENLLHPAFDLVDYKHYTDIRLGGIPGHFIKTGFMMANRGCPFGCKFCTENVRNVFRERAIDDIISEIKWQIKNYNIKGLVFLDDLFYYKSERVIDFCSAILRENIKLKIYAQTRVDRVGDMETLKLMKKAGFIQLALGVESGSPKILKMVNKGINLEQIRKGVKAINDAGIHTYSFIIIGFPDETSEDMEMTENLLKEINSTFVAVNYYMPMPGTPLYSEEDDKLLDEVSYSLTENQTFRTSDAQKALSHYRQRFQLTSERNPNYNLFRYPGFFAFLAGVMFLKPVVLLKGLYIQRTKKTYSSYFEAARTAMINYRIYG